MRVVLLGAPGAGKGTQAVLAARKFQIPHISTGEMMRATSVSGSNIGEQVRCFLDAGQLVPDALMIDVVRERISRADCAGGFLLDGFPRTLAQAEALEQLCADLDCDLTHVLEFTVPMDVLKQRLLNRGRTDGRSDDTPEVIEERLHVFDLQTRRVTDFYRERGKLTEVDGFGAIEEIQKRVVAHLQKS